MTNAPQSAPSAAGAGMLLLCLIVLVAAGLGLGASVGSRTPAAADQVPFSVRELRDASLGSLRPVSEVSKQVWVGGSPAETADLDLLAQRGVRTLVSVEALPPDVEGARERGMAVVHLPMTFREIPRQIQTQLARVAREQKGPFYVCCDDSRQRGPAAAMILWRCLDPHVSAEQSVATLRKIGSTAHPALAASLRDFTIPKAEELMSTSELPQTTHVPPLAASMAEIGRLWRQVQQDEPTPSGVSIAVRLATLDELVEKCREASELADIPPEMQPGFQDLQEALESLAESLKQDLRTAAGRGSSRDLPRVQDRCDRCHARFRN